MTIFVAEDITEIPERKMFTLLGVDYYKTSRAWLNPILMIGVGILLAFFIAPASQLLGQIMTGIVYGLLIILAGFFHGLGHILSSRMVGAPVSSIIETATVSVTRYDDNGEVLPSRVHVGRVLGGPVLNILVGVFVLAINVGSSNNLLDFFGLVSLLFGIFTLLPIPSLDGSVILRELCNWHN